MADEKSKLNGAAAISICIAVLIILFFIFCFRVVGVGQVGIVTRFGQVIGTQGPGILIHAPWPIEGLTKINVQTQKDNVQAGAATKDLQQLDTNVNFDYHINPAAVTKIFKQVQGADYDSIIVQPAIQEAVKANTAQYNADEEITNRPQVESAIFKDLQDKLASWGIIADSFSVLDFGFSSQYNAAIESKVVASQQAQQAQYDLQTAQLKAQQQVQAATLTPEYLELQMIQKWDGKTPLYVGNGANNIFGLPTNQ